MNWLGEAFQLVIATSWRAGLLILILLAMRSLVRGRIPNQVLFIGWIVVALRLLIPQGVPTSWSPCNLVAPLARAAAEVTDPDTFLWSEAPSLSPALTTLSEESRHPVASARQIATLVWISGIAVLLTARMGMSFSFRRKLLKSEFPADLRTLAMVRRCSKELGKGTAIDVSITEAVNTPALYGIIRPRLLLPPGLAEKLSDEELRLVILHELGHWRREDLLVQVLIQTGRIVHWFNPLVWLAARKSRTDCELACDEFVLRRQTPANFSAYGTALLKVLGSSREPLGSRCTMGLLEDKRQLKERIHRIASYKTASIRRSIAGLLLVAALTVVSTTHESWAQEAVKSVVSVLTKTPPEGWRRLPGVWSADFEVGIDPSQPFRGHHATGYVRATSTGEKNDYRGFGQACLADAYRGKRVRFSAWVKTEEVLGDARLWFRVDGEKRHGIQYDNMSKRPLRGSTDWTLQTVVLDVPAEAVSLNYGFSLVNGTGQAWFCEPRIEVVGPEVASTNTVQTLPELCGNPTCSSSICRKGTLKAGIVNAALNASLEP